MFKAAQAGGDEAKEYRNRAHKYGVIYKLLANNVTVVGVRLPVPLLIFDKDTLGIIPSPYAEQIRARQIKHIDVYMKKFL